MHQSLRVKGVHRQKGHRKNPTPIQCSEGEKKRQSEVGSSLHAMDSFRAMDSFTPNGFVTKTIREVPVLFSR